MFIRKRSSNKQYLDVQTMKSRVRLLIVIKAMQSYTNLTVIFFIVIQAECMAML